MKHVFLAIIALISVSGCTVARIQRMDESNANYKACLKQNPNKLSACEAQRLTYEADQNAVMATKPVY